MARRQLIAAALLCAPALATALQLLPPTGITPDEQNAFTDNENVWDIESSSRTIYIDEGFAEVKDDDGLTLIPPSGYDFAEVFLDDLTQITGFNWTLERVDSLPPLSEANGSILLGGFNGDSSTLAYENGTPLSLIHI